MEKDTKKQSVLLPRYRRIIPAVYFAVLALMLIIVIANVVWKDSPGADFGLGGFAQMDDGWYTEDGQLFEIAEIDKLRGGAADISVFHRLPDAIENDQSIVFRSKNCAVTVFVAGRQVYATDVAQAPFYNHSPGTRWNVFTVTEADAGQTVELRVEQAYQDGRAKVDNFYYGDGAAIVLHQINAKIMGGVVSLLIFFVGLVFLVAWLILNRHRAPRDNGLLWLGLFALVAACWSLLETNLFQFFSQNLRLLQVMDNMMLVLAGIPLYLYLDSVYEVFRSRFVRILCGLDAAYILLATISQMAGLWDYHQTLNGAVATFGVVVITLIVSLLKQRRKVRALPEKKDRFFYALQQVGILLLGLGLLGDLTRYLLMDVLDRAFVIRLGLLGFIVCFGAGNVYKMILLVKKGMEADLISQLAYQDGLTKLGNRTAYMERLEYLAKAHAAEPIGLVMFDLNDLKRVNDTLGHKFGDALIQRCAAIIDSAFAASWNVYRIGGDEFVALRHGADVRAAYQRSLDVFNGEIRRSNDDGTHEYTIAIAHGAAFSEITSQKTIEQIEKDADRNMYQDKYRLKCMEV